MKNANATKAWLRGGGGIHKDRRTKRNRVRGAKKRAAISEQRGV